VPLRSTIHLLIPLAFIAAVMPAAAARAQSRLVGNVFAQPWPAANFTLTDQNGKPFTLAPFDFGFRLVSRSGNAPRVSDPQNVIACRAVEPQSPGFFQSG